MKKFKKLAALILSILIMTAALAGCGGDKAPAEGGAAGGGEAGGESAGNAGGESGGSEKVKAVMVLQDSGGAAWGATKESFYRGVEAKGWDYEFMSPVTVNSVPEMITLCENAISVGCDVLITACTDGEMWADVLMRAQEQGIVVVGIVQPPSFAEGSDLKPEQLIDACVGFDGQAVGRLQAQVMADFIPADEKITAVYFHVDITDQIMEIYDAVVDELTKLRPDTVFLGIEKDENNPAKAADKLAALKLANPELNCAFGMDMGTALGIHSFVADNNLQGKFYSIGVDASVENLGTIKAGTVNFILEQGYAQFGEQALDVAEQILNGEEYEFYRVGNLTVIGVDNYEQYAIDNKMGDIPEL